MGTVAGLETLQDSAAVSDQGLIVIVDAATRDRISAGALKRCGSALLEVVRVSKNVPRVRSWPILLVSAQAQLLEAELRNTPGHLIPTSEYWLEAISVSVGPEAKADSDLCGSEAVIQGIRHALERTVLPRLSTGSGARSKPDARDVRAWANVNQACAILLRGAAAIHYDIHQRAGGGSRNLNRPIDVVVTLADRELRDIVAAEWCDDLKAQALKHQTLEGGHADADRIATYLEECAATIQLGVRVPSGLDKRVVIVLVDDQSDTLTNVTATVSAQPAVALERIDCGRGSVLGKNVDTAVDGALAAGVDPSAAAGRLVARVVEDTLTRVNAQERWLRDGCKFVIVTDIRLHRYAPSAGLEVIRRVRDRFPFATTIACTVRRGLAYELQDEGADGYLWKSDDQARTADELWTLVQELVWGSEGYYVETQEREREIDSLLLLLLERKYCLRPAKLGAPTLRFACFFSRKEPSECRQLLRDVPVGAVIGVLMQPDAGPLEMWDQLRSWKDREGRRIVLLKPTGARSNGSRLAEQPIRVCPSSVLKLDSALRPEPPKKFDTRWTLLVPRSAHCGTLNVIVDDEELEQYRAAVSERFGGATMSDAAGVWLESAKRTEIQDKNQKVEVLGRGTESARRFVRDLGAKILRELGQEEILLQEDRVSVWSITPEGVPALPVGLERDGLLNPALPTLAAEAAGL